MKYQISYQKNDVFQAIQINAQTEAEATAYFKEYKPTAVFIGISSTCDNKPGFPCVTVPEGWKPTQAPEEEPEEITVDLLRERLEAHPARSAWSRGVKMYAADLLEDLETAVSGGYFDMADLLTPRMLRAALLNGAADWNQFSWGGCSLIYNEDIAERLCTPSELKKTRHGERRPNSREEWLDTQARALFQAYNLIGRLARNI